MKVYVESKNKVILFYSLAVFVIFLTLDSWAGDLDDVADVPCQKLFAGNDPNKSYFLIGADKSNREPNSGFGLVLVMPGGDGSAEFNPFVRRIYKYSIPKTYLVAQPVAVKWSPKQDITWPTEKSTVLGQKFTTEEFIEAVIKEVKSKYKLNERYIFTLSWSSGGPAAYAISLQEHKSVTGSFVAMSVFHPGQLGPLANAKGHAYFIYHSPDDKTCPFRQAERAQNELQENGARVNLVTYAGGHGWHGNIYGDIRSGIEWLESAVSSEGKSSIEPNEPKLQTSITDSNQAKLNLILSDDFEKGIDTPDGWQKGENVAGVTYFWDRKIGYKSSSSLCLRKTVNNFFPIAQWQREVEHKTSNKKIQVTVQVKAIKASKAVVDVQFLDETGQETGHQWAAYIGAKEAADRPASHVWKEYSGTVEIPDGTKQMTFALQIYGPGTVWFDDLKVQYID